MRRGPEVLVRIKSRPKNGLGHGHTWDQAGWARGTQPFSLRQVIQHTAQIGVGFMAQGVRMPFVPIFVVQMHCMRKSVRVMVPSGGRDRMPCPLLNAMVKSVANAVQLPPKRGPQQGRHQQGVQPNRQA